jgi:hypothetical protein
MGLTDLKKKLKKLDKNKLTDLITDLYKKNKSAKEFLDFYVNPDEREILQKYRDKVFEALNPRRGHKIKLKDGKQAIRDFRNLGISAVMLADLMLFYVEAGVELTKDFGIDDDSFYASMETTYLAALKLMEKEDLLEKFVVRSAKFISDTGEIGWEPHAYLSEIHADFFADFLDEIIDKETAKEKGKVIQLPLQR